LGRNGNAWKSHQSSCDSSDWEDLGQADGNITLLPNVCLGCCDKAPALMLDGELVESLDSRVIDKLLQGLKGGENA
jgi:NADH:ubiquinone oxidoreductase subunit E